jgi:hypothetical protein
MKDAPKKVECPQCVEVAHLLRQKHAECWPCARKRHDRDYHRVQRRAAAIKAARAKDETAA